MILMKTFLERRLCGCRRSYPSSSK